MVENQTLFIKPSHLGNSTPRLNTETVRSNKPKNIETTLVLDNNVLVKMKRIVKAGNEYSSVLQHGLDNLVKFLNNCPPYSICLSPAFALNEMPP